MVASSQPPLAIRRTSSTSDTYGLPGKIPNTAHAPIHARPTLSIRDGLTSPPPTAASTPTSNQRSRRASLEAIPNSDTRSPTSAPPPIRRRTNPGSSGSARSSSSACTRNDSPTPRTSPEVETSPPRTPDWSSCTPAVTCLVSFCRPTQPASAPTASDSSANARQDPGPIPPFRTAWWSASTSSPCLLAVAPHACREPAHALVDRGARDRAVAERQPGARPAGVERRQRLDRDAVAPRVAADRGDVELAIREPRREVQPRRGGDHGQRACELPIERRDEPIAALAVR